MDDSSIPGEQSPMLVPPASVVSSKFPCLRHSGVTGGTPPQVAIGETEFDHQDCPRNGIGSTSPPPRAAPPGHLVKTLNTKFPAEVIAPLANIGQPSILHLPLLT